jgi:hypothetical protein
MAGAMTATITTPSVGPNAAHVAAASAAAAASPASAAWRTPMPAGPHLPTRYPPAAAPAASSNTYATDVRNAARPSVLSSFV